MIDGEDKLVRDAIRGEASAFGRLYDHYQPAIYRFVLIKVGHREEAEDLTHQVFLHAWQHVATYRPAGFPFSSWLYRIARNQIIDHYRTAKQATPIDDLPPELFPSTEDGETAVEINLLLEKVHRAIRGLKPDYQDIIVLRFVEELSVREAARAIGKSEGAVKVLQHRALKELQDLLDA
jgi:RNA polymerase sigma-70 factor, ECF subfamily